MVFFIVWYFLDVVGTILLRLNWAWYFHETLCPTPAQIIKGFVAALGGPTILLISIIIGTIDLCGRETKRWKWLHTPICHRKE